jgi:hypothetical protein
MVFLPQAVRVADSASSTRKSYDGPVCSCSRPAEVEGDKVSTQDQLGRQCVVLALAIKLSSLLPWFGEHTKSKRVLPSLAENLRRDATLHCD